MNRKILALILPLTVLSLSTNAQVNKASKLGLQFSYGFGSSVVQNEGINTRLGTTSMEVLGTYQFKEKHGISTGFSIIGLNGNGFNAIGNFNQTRGLVRVPVFLNTYHRLNDKTEFISSGGVFVNHIIEDSYRYVNSTEVVRYENWSMGVNARFGISYDVYTKAAVGLAYNIQYNFADFYKNPGSIDTRMSSNIFDLFFKFKL